MIGLWLACASPAPAPAPTAPAPTADTGPSPPRDPWAEGLVGDPDRGAERFLPRCATCHGEDGRGGLGPDLARVVPLHDDRSLYAVLTEGLGGMPAIGFTDDQEVVDLIAWLRVAFPVR